MRFRISPEMEIGVGTIVMGVNETMDGRAVEMMATKRPCPEEMEAYERMLGDAMAGDSSHFAREDYVEEAWRIVDPIRNGPTPVHEYERDTWGPAQVDAVVMPPGGWHNPSATDRETSLTASQAM